MKTLIINNLMSGLRDGAIFDFVRKLACDGDEITIRNTDGNTMIESLLEGADSFDCVVASGGDGTIASICYALRYSEIPILAFPAGTGNLLASNLGQAKEPHANIDLIRSALTLDFDIGEISFLSGDENVSRGFMVMGGAGYDARIMQAAERLKDPFGPGSYIIAALGNPSPQLAHFIIHLDDRIVELDGIAVLVMNFTKIYSDISILHDNDARDGQFEIAVLKQHHAVELLPALISAFLDRTGKHPNRTDEIESFKARKVRVESKPPLLIQYDGEARGYTTPFEARVLPRAVRLFVGKDEFKRLSERE